MTEKEIGCDNCYYTYFDEKAYPCSLCIRGVERTDMWQPSKKTKSESVTYNPTSVNNIWEKPTNPYIPNEQTEPQTDAFTKWAKSVADSYRDEPQTEVKVEPTWVGVTYGRFEDKPHTERSEQ